MGQRLPELTVVTKDTARGQVGQHGVRLPPEPWTRGSLLLGVVAATGHGSCWECRRPWPWLLFSTQQRWLL